MSVPLVKTGSTATGVIHATDGAYPAATEDALKFLSQLLFRVLHGRKTSLKLESRQGETIGEDTRGISAAIPI